MKIISGIFAKTEKIIDIWSVPHFLFGTVTALCVLALAVDFWFSYAVLVALAVGWEIFEIKARIRETGNNVASDIVLPLIAYPLTFLLAETMTVDMEQRVALAVVSVFLFCVINFFSWQARYYRDPDFMN